MSEPKRLRISPEEAHKMVAEKNATPVDVIDSVSYDHFDHQIEGAVRIAPEDVGEDFTRLPKDRAAIAY